MPDFPRFLTTEEAAQLLGVSVARISLWIGECKLPVAARSEYAGYLLRALTVETVGRALADALTPEARSEPVVEAPCFESRTRGPSVGARSVTCVKANQSRAMHMT